MTVSAINPIEIRSPSIPFGLVAWTLYRQVRTERGLLKISYRIPLCAARAIPGDAGAEPTWELYQAGGPPKQITALDVASDASWGPIDTAVAAAAQAYAVACGKLAAGAAMPPFMLRIDGPLDAAGHLRPVITIILQPAGQPVVMLPPITLGAPGVAVPIPGVDELWAAINSAVSAYNTAHSLI